MTKKFLKDKQFKKNILGNITLNRFTENMSKLLQQLFLWHQIFFLNDNRNFYLLTAEMEQLKIVKIILLVSFFSDLNAAEFKIHLNRVFHF